MFSVDEEFDKKINRLVTEDPRTARYGSIRIKYFENKFLQNAINYYEEQQIPTRSETSFIEYICQVIQSFFTSDFLLKKSYFRYHPILNLKLDLLSLSYRNRNRCSKL